MLLNGTKGTSFERTLAIFWKMLYSYQMQVKFQNAIIMNYRFVRLKQE